MTQTDPPIRVPAQEEWANLPVQPPAVVYRRILRYPIIAALATLVVLIAMAFMRGNLDGVHRGLRPPFGRVLCRHRRRWLGVQALSGGEETGLHDVALAGGAHEHTV
jgi:hypothetical protein